MNITHLTGAINGSHGPETSRSAEAAERLASTANKTSHALMVDVLSQVADRGELRERFAADAAVSERETLESGKYVPLGVAFDYLEARMTGKSARRPRERAGRASK